MSKYMHSDILFVSLHGSRFLQINYPERDVDLVIVTSESCSEDNVKQILESVSQFLREKLDIKAYCIDMITKEKLWLLSFLLDHDDTEVLFEIVVYREQKYLRWKRHNISVIEKWSEEERSTYIADMREARLVNDVGKLYCLKE